VCDADGAIIVCDLPGELTPTIDELLECLDELIILARSDEADQIENWEARADSNGTNTFGTFVTHLNASRSAEWDAKSRTGHLCDLKREAVNEDKLEALPEDTQTTIRFIAAELKQKARTEYRDS